MRPPDPATIAVVAYAVGMTSPLAATSAAVAGSIVQIGSAQTTNVDTTFYADRGAFPKSNSTKVRFTTAAGATPTVTVRISVSVDAVTWSNATYADVSTPTTDVSTTFAITTSGITEKIVKSQSSWRYLKCTFSANTNQTVTTEVIFDDNKRWV